MSWSSFSASRRLLYSGDSVARSHVTGRAPGVKVPPTAPKKLLTTSSRPSSTGRLVASTADVRVRRRSCEEQEEGTRQKIIARLQRAPRGTACPNEPGWPVVGTRLECPRCRLDTAVIVQGDSTGPAARRSTPARLQPRGFSSRCPSFGRVWKPPEDAEDECLECLATRPKLSLQSELLLVNGAGLNVGIFERSMGRQWT